jgi:hypothetical protein
MMAVDIHPAALLIDKAASLLFQRIIVLARMRENKQPSLFSLEIP